MSLEDIPLPCEEDICPILHRDYWRKIMEIEAADINIEAETEVVIDAEADAEADTEPMNAEVDTNQIEDRQNWCNKKKITDVISKRKQWTVFDCHALETYHAKGDKERNLSQLERLNQIKMPAQRTPEWYQIRKERFTASNLMYALGYGGRKKQLEVYLDKLNPEGPSFKGNMYTEWGIKYEEFAVRVYESLKNCTVHDFGLLIDDNGLPIGASPDGIATNGRMLEIKCPYSRQITGIIPDHYWVQQQCQMYVAKCTSCDYLEVEIMEYENHTEFMEDDLSDSTTFEEYTTWFTKTENLYDSGKTPAHQGIVVTLFDNEIEYKKTYVTCPIVSTKETQERKSEMNEWVRTIRETHIDVKKIKVSYIRTALISCLSICYDKDWWDRQIPIIHQAWEECKSYENNLSKLREDISKQNKRRKKALHDTVSVFQ